MSNTTKQPTGDFYAPINRYKQPGDSKPIFTGHMTQPGSDAKEPFALWAFEYTTKDGEVLRGYSGGINGVATNIPAQAQIEVLMADAHAGNEVNIANLTLRPGQTVLFTNTFKADAPDKNRPDLWGWTNPTDGKPPFRQSVWLKQFEDSGRPYLSGVTQYPLPGKSEREQQDATPDLEQIMTQGAVTKGMPKKRESGGRS
ncbi:MAG: hypothetical protein H6876_06385 [Hyphomicrobiaceae bacterium]|nr:hypothetical protein [Hyphomicrobiaceae bacterium]